jgi:hypothetical protein
VAAVERGEDCAPLAVDRFLGTSVDVDPDAVRPPRVLSELDDKAVFTRGVVVGLRDALVLLMSGLPDDMRTGVFDGEDNDDDDDDTETSECDELVEMVDFSFPGGLDAADDGLVLLT